MLRYLVIYKGHCVGCYIQLVFKGYVGALVICPSIGVKWVIRKIVLVASDTVFEALKLPHLGKRRDRDLAIEAISYKTLYNRFIGE